MSAFSLYDFGVPGIVHFQLFEVPQEPCLNEVRYCNNRLPPPPLPHLRILKVFTSCYWGKRVLEKMILVLEKSLIFPKKFCMNYVKHIFFVKDQKILLFSEDHDKTGKK